MRGRQISRGQRGNGERLLDNDALVSRGFGGSDMTLRFGDWGQGRRGFAFLPWGVWLFALCSVLILGKMSALSASYRRDTDLVTLVLIIGSLPLLPGRLGLTMNPLDQAWQVIWILEDVLP